MYKDDFDEMFKSVVKEIKGMTMYQTDCFLYDIYEKYWCMIGIRGYDKETFISMVKFNDIKLKDDAHVKRLMNNDEEILEKYNKGVLYGTNENGIRYYNHFKRDNDGFWYFHYYEEEKRY